MMPSVLYLLVFAVACGCLALAGIGRSSPHGRVGPVFSYRCRARPLFSQLGRSLFMLDALVERCDDPAVPRGHNPLSTTDRYSLALIFLRVAGAANFPIQARQRGGDGVEVRFPVPAGPASAALMDPDAEVWQLCARALSLAAPERRPPASAWFGPLARLVAALGGPAGPEEGAYVRSPAEAPHRLR